MNKFTTPGQVLGAALARIFNKMQPESYGRAHVIAAQAHIRNYIKDGSCDAELGFTAATDAANIAEVTTWARKFDLLPEVQRRAPVEDVRVTAFKAEMTAIDAENAAKTPAAPVTPAVPGKGK